MYIAGEGGNIKVLNEKSVCMHLLDEQLTKGNSLLHVAIMASNIVMCCHIDFPGQISSSIASL